MHEFEGSLVLYCRGCWCSTLTDTIAFSQCPTEDLNDSSISFFQQSLVGICAMSNLPWDQVLQRCHVVHWPLGKLTYRLYILEFFSCLQNSILYLTSIVCLYMLALLFTVGVCVWSAGVCLLWCKCAIANDMVQKKGMTRFTFCAGVVKNRFSRDEGWYLVCLADLCSLCKGNQESTGYTSTVHCGRINQ